MNFYDQLHNQNRRMTVVEDARRLPNGETLSEHREHCEARPGHCPYEAAARKGDRSDDLTTIGGGFPRTNIPSLRDFDRHVASKERAWMRKAGVTPQQFRTIKANLAKTMEDVLNRFPIGVSIRSTAQLKKTKVIREVLRYGFRNIYETKEGGGTTDPIIRRGTEAANFGWSDSLAKRMKPSDRPKYGMLANGYRVADRIRMFKQMGLTKAEIQRELAKSPQPNEEGVVEYGDSMYGRNFITLKKDKVNATFVVGDSMDNLLQKPAVSPSRLSEPSPVSLNPGGKLIEMLKQGPVLGLTTDDIRRMNGGLGNDRYIEVQLHGQVPPESIDEIRFADMDEFKEAGLTKEDWGIIDRLGIKVSVNGKKVLRKSSTHG